MARPGQVPSATISGVSEVTLLRLMAPKLALLYAVDAEENLTRAAVSGGVPQPTASRWLAALSAELGTTVVVPLSMSSTRTPLPPGRRPQPWPDPPKTSS